jgi:mRNA interferase RelE/StbE
VTWTVRFTPSAERQADALDPPIHRRIAKRLAQPASDPHSAANVTALVGSDQYRLRVGDWRVVYTLDDAVLIVLVLRIGHRREVYR